MSQSNQRHHKNDSYESSRESAKFDKLNDFERSYIEANKNPYISL